MRTFIASIKLLLFFVVTILIIPTQSLVLVFDKSKYSYFVPDIWHKLVCKIFCIKIIINGVPQEKAQTMFVSSHLSYLDIPVLGSTIKASFVAKSDVESWPVFGFLSKLQQTAYISRDRLDAKKGEDTLGRMLNEGKSLILFPEGTSTDGKNVYPFKSSLFSIIFKDGHQSINIQPVTLRMIEVNKKGVVTQEDRDLYAWHINMDTPLAEHLWRFAKSKGAIISLTFHPIIGVNDFSDRKTLAKACHKAVSNELIKNSTT